jgi:hypothetical protein
MVVMATSRGKLAETAWMRNPFRFQQPLMANGARRGGKRELVAEAGADGHALAADGATAAENGCAGLGLHARAEAVGFHALAAVGLKCALGHENALLFPKENLRLDGKF